MSLGPEWRYRITLDTPDWYDVQCWCEANLGEFDKTWYKLGIDPAEYVIEGRTRTVWYFKDERDAIKFSLRWS
jgi:hypothetical protein